MAITQYPVKRNMIAPASLNMEDLVGSAFLQTNVPGATQQVRPPAGQTMQAGPDPTAMEIMKRLFPDRSQSGQAADQAEADRIRSESFGGRAGGFAPDKPGYVDDPTKSMAERMNAFHNRTTRKGQQTIGPDQERARAAAGMGTQRGIANGSRPVSVVTADRFNTDPNNLQGNMDLFRSPTSSPAFSAVGSPDINALLDDAAKGNPGYVPENPANAIAAFGATGKAGAGMTPYGPVQTSGRPVAIDPSALVNNGSTGASPASAHDDIPNRGPVGRLAGSDNMAGGVATPPPAPFSGPTPVPQPGMPWPTPPRTTDPGVPPGLWEQLMNLVFRADTQRPASVGNPPTPF